MCAYRLPFSLRIIRTYISVLSRCRVVSTHFNHFDFGNRIGTKHSDFHSRSQSVELNLFGQFTSHFSMRFIPEFARCIQRKCRQTFGSWIQQSRDSEGLGNVYVHKLMRVREHEQDRERESPLHTCDFCMLFRHTRHTINLIHFNSVDSTTFHSWFSVRFFCTAFSLLRNFSRTYRVHTPHTVVP